jgi:hypothetical protein
VQPKPVTGSHGPSLPHGIVGFATILGEHLAHKGAGLVLVGGTAVAIAGAVWEGFQLGLWLRDWIDRPGKEREARREAWRTFMWNNFWFDYQQMSNAMREAAFDKLAGDRASHGITPALTKEAAATSVTLKNEIADRWQRHLYAIEALQSYIDKGPYTGEVVNPDPDHPQRTGGGFKYPAGPRSEQNTIVIDVSGNWTTTQTGEIRRSNSPDERKEASIEAARAQIEHHQRAMVDDLKTLTEYETNPANWELTPEQKGRLQ